MNIELWLWSGALLALSALLLALPFVPAWAEWRRPRDHAALDVETGPASDPHFGLLQLHDGEVFETLQAPCIVLGDGPPISPATLPPLQRWQPPPSARPWGVQGWLVPHDLHIPAGQLVPYSLVVRGRCVLQGPSRIEGDLKSRGKLRIGAGCQVHGGLFGEADVRIDTGSQVSGVVMAEGRLQLAPRVVIGSQQHPVSVCADVVEARGPVRLHGSVQARVQGHVARAPHTPPLSP
jgi:cytoskeletal protein CcmA (bactofilin family)